MIALALVGCAAMDPAPGMWRTYAWARRHECERLDARSGSRRYPGVIAEPGPRGELFERDMVVCEERFAPDDLRPAREEAILSILEAETGGIAEAIASARPDLAGRTWLVEAFDPNAEVGAKIAFASKNALMRSGLRVSDRKPLLSWSDLDVITRMEPDQAYPTACRRWTETGSLGASDVLLAVLTRDRRATTLSGGLCESGRWTWIR